MTSGAAALVADIAALWPWEAMGVALAIAYLVLAIRENPWCWPAGMASSAIYLALFFGKTLYMESALQLFYIGIAVYGWRRWLGGRGSGGRETRETPAPVPITSWGAREHVLALAVVGALTLANGAVLAAHTPAALPYLDSLVAWGSVVTTWMVARKVLENWLYWFVIDALSAYVYASRGLWLTAALFAAYLVLIVIGYATWRRHMGYSRPAEAHARTL